MDILTKDGVKKLWAKIKEMFATKSELGFYVGGGDAPLAESLVITQTDEDADIDLYNANGTPNTQTSIWNATTTRAGTMTMYDKISLTKIEDTLNRLIPTALEVDAPKRITWGNVTPIAIKAVLSPVTTFKNIIYISDNKAVLVGTDGKITPIAQGKSTVSIIPTLNTSLAKTIIIEVGEPQARLVNNRTTLRLTSNGNIRLT